jgi:hypothetical protein
MSPRLALVVSRSALRASPRPPDTGGRSRPWHRDLVLLGPTATPVTMLEHSAGVGEVPVGNAIAADIGPELVGPHDGRSHLLAGVPTPREPSTAAGT